MSTPEQKRGVSEEFLTKISNTTGIPDPIEHAKVLYLGNEFTIAGVAKELGVSHGTAYRLLGMGEVPIRDANIQRVILQDAEIESRRKQRVEEERGKIIESSRQRSQQDKRGRQEELLGAYPEAALQLLYNTFRNTTFVAAYLSSNFEMQISRHTIGNWAKEMGVNQGKKESGEKSVKENPAKKQVVLGDNPVSTLKELVERFSSDRDIAQHLSQTHGVSLHRTTVRGWRQEEGVERIKKKAQRRKSDVLKDAVTAVGIDLDLFLSGRVRAGKSDKEIAEEFNLMDIAVSRATVTNWRRSMERRNKPTIREERVIVDFSRGNKTSFIEDTRPIVEVDGEEGRVKELTNVGGEEVAIVVLSNNKLRIVPVDKISYKDKTSHSTEI